MDFSKIEAIIFDFDGVIANTAVDIARAVNATLEHFDCKPLSQEQVIIFVGNGAEKLLKRSIAASIQISKKQPSEVLLPPFEEIYAWYIEYYRTHCVEKSELYPGVQDLLELLSIEDILNNMGIIKYFDSVIGPEQTSHVKPDPEGLFLAMETINKKRQANGKSAILPENVLMVGDSHTDIEAGKNAGTKTCALTNGYGNKEKLMASQADCNLVMVCELIVHLQRTIAI